jgi:hypothetical protein
MEHVEIQDASNQQLQMPTNSQDSTHSAGALSLPGLITSSSDLSTMTMETDTTSPISVTNTQMMPPKPIRVNSSELLVAESSSDDVTSTDDSIVSLETTGLNRGSKRTASGAVKLPSEMRGAVTAPRTAAFKNDLSAAEVFSVSSVFNE